MGLVNSITLSAAQQIPRWRQLPAFAPDRLGRRWIRPLNPERPQHMTVRDIVEPGIVHA
jgi:hypothetical protein